MKAKATLWLAVAVIAIFSANFAQAAGRTKTTTITVKGMYCQSCAKKLCTALDQIPGVGSSTANAKKETAVVVPAQGKKMPSPRALWEAVEKTGYKPVRLACPFGVFTKKPRF